MLPPRRSLAGKDRSAHEKSSRIPEVRDVSADICLCFIETHACDVAAGVRFELHPKFGRIHISAVQYRRRCGGGHEGALCFGRRRRHHTADQRENKNADPTAKQGAFLFRPKTKPVFSRGLDIRVEIGGWYSRVCGRRKGFAIGHSFTSLICAKSTWFMSR